MAARDSLGALGRHPGDTLGSLVPRNPLGDTPGSSVPPQGRGSSGTPNRNRPSGPSSPLVLLHDVTAALGDNTKITGILPKNPPRDKPKTVRIITKDVVRELIVPRARCSPSLLVPRADLQRLREEALPAGPGLAQRRRILRARQRAAFERLRKIRSAELRDGDRDRDRDKDEEEEEEKEEEEARKISGPSSPLVLLQDTRSDPSSRPQDKPKTIRVITKDVVRELIVPRARCSPSLLVPRADLQRLREEALPAGPGLAQRRRILRARQRAAFEERLGALREQQLREEQREPRDPDPELERERRELLERAAGMRLEQEEEMRQLSSLLQSARCSSILDLQLAERLQLRAELGAEEQRLEQLMERGRQEEQRLQEELQRRRRQELVSTKQEVLRQVEQRRELRALRAEQKSREGQKFLEELEQIRKEEREAWQQRQQHKRQLLAEMRAADVERARLRQRDRDRDRRDELRALEEQRQKEARDAALEAERARQRRERQRNLERVTNVEEREWQKAREALRLKRSEEAAERAWRCRELQRERRRAELLRELQRDRHQQVTNRRQQVALALQQERRDFLAMLSAQQAELARERAQCQARGRAGLAHAAALREQIRESRQRRERDRAAELEERQRQQRQQLERAQELERAGERKLQRLRASGVPERYCALVARRAWGTAGVATPPCHRLVPPWGHTDTP